MRRFDFLDQPTLRLQTWAADEGEVSAPYLHDIQCTRPRSLYREEGQPLFGGGPEVLTDGGDAVGANLQGGAVEGVAGQEQLPPF